MTLLIIFIIFLLVVADQATKFLMLTWLKPQGQVELIPGFMRLRFVLNDGAAFSMLKNGRWLFVIVTGVLIIACFVALFSRSIKERIPALHSPFLKTCLVLISSGGLGNLIDRLFRGQVIDFIEPTFVNFAVFNVADIFVTCGAIMIIIYLVYDIFFEFGAKRKYVKNGWLR